MPDSFSEVSSKSWFERIKESIKGVLFGIVLFVAAFPLLWWNEGRAVQTYKSLVEGAASVVDVAADQVDAANEKKLVHLTGEATTTETLTDQTFAISANAIKLSRKVEMYQWKEDEKRETRKKVGGGEETFTTWTYDKVWSESQINSDKFEKRGYENPRGMKYSSDSFVAGKVTLGAFRLSDLQVGKINNFTKLPVDQNTLANLPPDIRQAVIIHSDGYYLPYNPAPPAAQPVVQPPKQPEPAQPAPPAAENPDKTNEQSDSAPANNDDAAEPAATQPADPQPVEAQPAPPATPAATPPPPSSANPSNPQVGDIRISFSVVKPGVVSVIAQQVSDSFQPYQTKAGDPLDDIKIGTHSAEEMFEAAQRANAKMTWILRLVGFLMMMFGLVMVFQPLVVVADFLPVLGSLLGMGLFAFAAIVAAALSLVTIAIAWLVYRPVFGVALIAVAIAAIVGLIMMGRKRKAAAA